MFGDALYKIKVYVYDINALYLLIIIFIENFDILFIF